MLSCRALRKSYVTERGEVLAVGGIDLDVEAGRYAAIIGRSGSGKSSLMAMVGGLSRPSDGSVVIDGTDIWGLSDDQLAQAGRLRWLSSVAAGLDEIATPALLARGIVITNASGVHGPNIAEHVLAMMLMFTRGLPALFRAQLARRVSRRSRVPAPSATMEPARLLRREVPRCVLPQCR